MADVIEEDGCSVDEETLLVEVESAEAHQKGDAFWEWTASRLNSVTVRER